MEYSPRNAIPYVCRTDAGTVELVREAGVEVVSSGDLIQRFEATWDDEQWAMHREAERYTTAAYDLAWDFIERKVQAEGGTSENEVQCRIMDHFRKNGLTTYSPPIVAVTGTAAIRISRRPGSATLRSARAIFVLIDLWAKLDRPRTVYSDLTRVASSARACPDEYEEIFQIVAEARDAAIARVQDAFAAGTCRSGAGRSMTPPRGDRGRRLRPALHPPHRPQHRPGGPRQRREHGQPRDARGAARDAADLLLDRAGHLPRGFGVRSEVNVFIDADGQVHVTGGPAQEKVVAILA